MFKKIADFFILYILPSLVLFATLLSIVLINGFVVINWPFLFAQLSTASVVFGIFAGIFVRKYQKQTEITIQAHKAREIEERERRIKVEKEAEIRKKQKQLEEKTKQELELSGKLKDAFTTNAHLANVISGINHEVSPWIGGIKNIVSRLQTTYKKSVSGEKITRSGEHLISNLPKDMVEAGKTVDKFDQILKALDHITKLLHTLSSDVKKLQQYSHVKSSIKDTIVSWVSLILMDRFIKDLICDKNIRVNEQNLDFVATHSPLHLSQIVLNLAKNSIEHNQDMLDTLCIDIYGIPWEKKLIYEDNGKGIPEDKLLSIFDSGTTTKEQNKSQHGLGLYLCKDYCAQMGATIQAVKKEDGKGARFIITFDTAEQSGAHRIVPIPTGSIIKRRRLT